MNKEKAKEFWTLYWDLRMNHGFSNDAAFRASYEKTGFMPQTKMPEAPKIGYRPPEESKEERILRILKEAKKCDKD